MNHHLRIANCAAAVALLASIATASAHAQKAALVQDINGPGRTPYVQGVSITPNASICSDTSTCGFVLPAVPAGKRLVVTQYSVDYWASYVTSISNYILIGSSGRDLVHALTLPVTAGVGGTTSVGRYVAAGQISYYVEAGDSPMIVVTQTGILQAALPAHATVVGYLVSAP